MPIFLGEVLSVHAGLGLARDTFAKASRAGKLAMAVFIGCFVGGVYWVVIGPVKPEAAYALAAIPYVIGRMAAIAFGDPSDLHLLRVRLAFAAGVVMGLAALLQKLGLVFFLAGYFALVAIVEIAVTCYLLARLPRSP